MRADLFVVHRPSFHTYTISPIGAVQTGRRNSRSSSNGGPAIVIVSIIIILGATRAVMTNVPISSIRVPLDGECIAGAAAATIGTGTRLRTEHSLLLVSHRRVLTESQLNGHFINYVRIYNATGVGDACNPEQGNNDATTDSESVRLTGTCQQRASTRSLATGPRERLPGARHPIEAERCAAA